MRFDDQNVDTSSLDDRRGMRGTTIGAGAGGLGLLGLLFVLLFGGGLSFDDGQSTTTTSQAQDLAIKCAQPGALDQYDDCFVLKIFNETDEVWTREFRERGSAYEAPRLVFFSGSTQTGCGPATAQTGPFYCPPDQRVYFDLDFLRQLQSQFGARGQYAQAYITAHEVGHHIQTITGIEEKVRRQQQANPRQANALSVRMELQADCIAGVWGRLANDRGNVVITKREYDQALRAAAAVGDDRIMQKTQGRVNPEAFTHGSSAQRQEWFARGFNTGDINRCDTFAS
ncbi:MAG TPA: neutral zinc metallopeptidase [Actinomycetota bacterium]|nr:neutral zinc metallopeptidase [Actinomycetota bacterium]